jgi:hypothetical protein
MFKQYVAAAAIAPYRIVVPGGTAGTVQQAAAASGKSFGVSWDVAPVTGERVDVCHMGIHLVEAGGAFTAGDPVTSDAQGRAVVANTAGQRVVGISQEAATAAGDLVQVLIVPHVF